ncbi:hypothetical protein E2C01_029808 [Portunus trituberculatus]|uniref:Uncharacterized protein n=1 Tax=Portunus trituberculatus TaxID=210409 RepID=A0A5B7EQB2_PORTR|nr:hypothetical protein [Portunus trituberculatus]
MEAKEEDEEEEEGNRWQKSPKQVGGAKIVTWRHSPWKGTRCTRRLTTLVHHTISPAPGHHHPPAPPPPGTRAPLTT